MSTSIQVELFFFFFFKKKVHIGMLVILNGWFDFRLHANEASTVGRNVNM
jgi:hypothetical protein